MIDINGIAHIQLSVTDFAVSRDFYHWLLHEMFGMTVQYDSDDVFYCIGGRTGLLITPADPALGGVPAQPVPLGEEQVLVEHVAVRVPAHGRIKRLRLNIKMLQPPKQAFLIN